jgi:hypothetical protein
MVTRYQSKGIVSQGESCRQQGRAVLTPRSFRRRFVTVPIRVVAPEQDTRLVAIEQLCVETCSRRRRGIPKVLDVKFVRLAVLENPVVRVLGEHVHVVEARPDKVSLPRIAGLTARK